MTDFSKKHPETDPRPARAKDDDEVPVTPRTDDAGLDDAMRALEFALDKKALEPVLLDVRGLCTYCNYQLVVSGRSDRQVDAIAEGIIMGLRDEGIRALSHEGKRSGQWALLDFGDLVVHVFHHPAREHYDLEGLWIDAPRVALEVPDDARVNADQY